MPTFLGIDYGRRRVGFAVSDPDAFFATGVATENVKSRGDAVEATLRVCAERDIDIFVVGLPLNMDGSEGEMAAEVRGFAADLGKRDIRPIRFWDERLTSFEADSLLSEAQVYGRRRKAVRDRVAAQVMLQGYIDAGAPPKGRAE